MAILDKRQYYEASGTFKVVMCVEEDFTMSDGPFELALMKENISNTETIDCERGISLLSLAVC